MVGSIHELTIDSLANSGEGVGRIDGRVVFVPNASPQDFLKIKITFSKKTFLKAQIIEILKPSPFRIKPLCTFATECGGCDWQHISYEQQLVEKSQNLLQTLKKIGKLENIPLEPIVPCSKPFGYRNRIQLQYDKNGFYYLKKGSHSPVYIDQCLIAEDLINKNFEFCYNTAIEKKNKAKIELATVRGQIKTFSVDKHGNSSLGFRQVNDTQNDVLVEKTLETIASLKIKSLIDLYCGQGNWSLAVNKALPEVSCLGIESNPINIKKAQKHSHPMLRFLEGKVEEVYLNLNEQADLVIIDPPRAGCSPEVLDAIIKKKPKRLIYISCHPATLARDLQYLTKNSWTIDEILPVDMFPQTPHLETWSLLHSDS